VWDTLNRNALAGFAGTVTFDRKMVRPDDSDEAGGAATVQHWSITTDGRGSLRAELTSSYSNGDTPIRSLFGKTPARSWIIMDNEMLVLEHGASSGKTQEDVAIRLMRNQTRSAEHYLERLLGGPSLDGSMDMLMVDRTSDNPSAVVKVDGQIHDMEFQRTEHGLFRTEDTYSDDVATYRWNYSEYRNVADHWLPVIAEFHQVSDTESWRNISLRYSNILVSVCANPNSIEFRKSVNVPHPSDPEIENRVTIVMSISDDGLTYDSGPFVRK